MDTKRHNGKREVQRQKLLGESRREAHTHGDRREQLEAAPAAPYGRNKTQLTHWERIAPPCRNGKMIGTSLKEPD